MIRRPPRSTRTDTLFPYTTLCRSKAEAALSAGRVPIVCVGETEKERSADQTLAVISRQVKGSIPVGMEAARLVVAYEPVWAIGTGRTATPADVAKVHAEIRRLLVGLVGEGAEKVRILYEIGRAHV